MEGLAEPGGPILVVGATANPFSRYATEILLAEGLNEYAYADISAVSAGMLSSYDVVIVGDISLTSAQVTLFTDWTNAGGLLIAFSPDPQLAPLLGLSAAGGVLSNRYLLVHTGSGPGQGIVNQTIQFQGGADLYTLNGASSLATLHAGANAPTSNPAVSIRTVGTLGGKAVAFTYDLARSVVYTRQGNPEWSGQERDGLSPIRSDDQYFPDWVDLNKVAIPMADEQQRLLANIILQNARKPLPRFWYLPRSLKAVVVMTGDDHGVGGTKGRFNQYLQQSADNSAEAVADWRAIRGSSYIYPNTPITDAEARAFEQQGFEVALHLSTNCQNFTPSSWDQFFNTQLATFISRFPSVARPVTNRTHCIAWSDWQTQPKAEAAKGIRLDANYYYWPAKWVQNRPGMFSGSGIPMRFTELNGTLIDCYQLVTQMTDESDQVYPFTIDNLLDRALGPEGYYGVFCANMHTDATFSDGSDKIIASAKARNVPVISARQLLTWLDGRNGSSFGNMSWAGNNLAFTISVASGARNLQGMLPVTEATGLLQSLTVNGAPVTFTTEIIKGISYAFFPGVEGSYVATYAGGGNRFPTASIASPAHGATFTAPATFEIAANASDTDGTISKVEFFQGSTKLGEDLSNPFTFSWSNVATGNYTLTARATDNQGAVGTSAPVNVTVNRTCPCTVFQAAEAPAGNLWNDGRALQLGMKFRSSLSGFVTGVRFYKQSGNTGTHLGQLYSSTGSLLAQATFVNETATGWQQVDFATPVAINPNTTYVITYHSSSGFYSGTPSYFGSAIDRSPLRALANGEDGPNGVYQYSNSPAFPTTTTGAGNYWVDLVFNTTAPTGPTVAITSPVNGATFTAPASIAIAANASDTDGTISKVEFFQGSTKLGEDLSSPYTFSWSNVAAGNYTLTARATDNGGSTGTSSPVNVTVSGPPAPCPCTVFRSTDAPSGSLQNEGSPVQLGMKFRSSVNGFATGVRFYKQSGNNGTHIGQLYSSTGSLLAQATFFNETASGWQQVDFATPVALTANTTYLISYHSSAGHYSVDDNGFAQSKVNGSLTGLQNGFDGPNGVYRYTSSPAFPTSNYLSSNYFVDVVFNNTAPSNELPTATITSPVNGAAFTAPATIAIAATASDTDGTISKVEFFQGSTKLGEALSSPYTFSWSNVAAGNYTLTARATDNVGGVGASAPVNVTVSGPPPVCPCTVFQAAAAPTGVLQNDANRAVQLGMKFRSSVNGFATGVRFYKQSGNTGTHIGQLYSSTGSLLAQATFVNETATGWQQVAFATPVALTANTTYLISYHSSAGNYSADDNGFDQAIVNGPLTGLRKGTDGANGVYQYSSTPAFPTRNFKSSNYFVDVVFHTSLAAPAAGARLGLATIEPGQLHLQEEGMEVHPNPFSEKATVRFVLAQGGAYSLGLYDAKGKRIALLQEGQAKAGETKSIEVDGARLAKGLYLLRLETNTGARTAKLILDR